MTDPVQMNCAHSESGWCLDCVAKLKAERDEAARRVDVWREQVATYCEIALNDTRRADKAEEYRRFVQRERDDLSRKLRIATRVLAYYADFNNVEEGVGHVVAGENPDEPDADNGARADHALQQIGAYPAQPEGPAGSALFRAYADWRSVRDAALDALQKEEP